MESRSNETAQKTEDGSIEGDVAEKVVVDGLVRHSIVVVVGGTVELLHPLSSH